MIIEEETPKVIANMLEAQTARRTIGKYEILGTLGRGAMGVVYQARDPEIGRLVAIKTLRQTPSLGSAELQERLERFRSEARSAGNLRHPHLIAIFEINQDQGMPYLVMDYVEGESLDRLIAREGRLAPERAMHYLGQVASALFYAHAQGVVHRDVKPANIIIDKDDRAYVLDFGVAQLGATLSSAESSVIVGTPAYMAPEQILRQTIDARADVFALAAVTFEALSGQRPFSGDSFNEVVSSILSGESLSLSDLAPEAPLALEGEFEQAFQRDPSKRHKNPELLIDAFCAALGLQSTVPRQGYSGPRYQPSRKRRSTGWKLVKGGLNSVSINNRPIASLKGNNSDSPMSDPGNFRGRAAFGMLSEQGESTLYRTVVVLGAICLAFGSLILYLLFGKISSYPGLQNPPARALLSEQDLSRETDFPLLAPLGSKGKLVAELNDQEVMDVLSNHGEPEGKILDALSEAKVRRLAGLFEKSVKLLDSDSYLTRIASIKMLGELGDKRGVPQLLLALDDHDPLVRGHAAKAIGNLGDRTALERLLSSYQKETVLEVKAVIQRAIERINGFPVSLELEKSDNF